MKTENKRVSRELLANPFPLSTREERMKKAGIIDLKDNCVIKEYDNDYFEFIYVKNTRGFSHESLNMLKG